MIDSSNDSPARNGDRCVVIILNYNSANDCAKCISFLRGQKKVNLEIVVVDNYSQEEEVIRIKQLCKTTECTLLLNNQNKGYSAGNNVGLRYAVKKGYDYALIANPDMEFPQTDYINKLMKRMKMDNRIAVAGSDIVGADGIHQNPMKPDAGWRNSFAWAKSLFKKKVTEAYSYIDDYRKSHYCHKLGGCCMLLNLSFIREIGYLDEFPFLYCEEAILSKQVKRLGWKMMYSAEEQAVHRHIHKEKGNPIGRFKEWRRSRIYYIEKYSDDGRFGKQIAKLSMRVYIDLMIIVSKIKTYTKNR